MRMNLVVLALGAGLAHTLFAAGPAVDFDRQVRPILSDNCFACHGPDEKHRMAGLHFDTKDGAFSKTGVIVPGDSAHSKMYFQVSNPNEALRMPPPYSGRKLTPQQVETIKNWIDSGSQMGYALGLCPSETSGAPHRNDEKWARNPIDRFVLARLEKEGLQPVAGSGQGDAAPPGHLRSDRASAHARRGRGFPGRPVSPDAYEKWSTGCCLPSLWRADGDAVARFRPLRRHARLSHRQRTATCGSGAIGSSRRSTATCRTTSSRSSNSPATCCRTPRWSSRSPPASIATT